MWLVRWTVGTVRKQKKLALADDFAPADGVKIMDYWQAQRAANKATRNTLGDDPSMPITVAQAIDQYQQNLKVVGGDVANAARLRYHCSPELLARPVALLTHNQLVAWRDGLAEKMAAASVNRVRHVLRAALTLVAKRNRSAITNEGAWEDLELLPNATRARNVYLQPHEVLQLIDAAYACDQGLGLLVETMAQTGSRPSQLVRLRVRDLDGAGSRLWVPRSGKGHSHKRTEKRQERVPVPIPPELAALLKDESRGRGANERLLRRTDGSAWNPKDAHRQYRDQFADAAAAVGLDPNVITMYGLRHSYISRALLDGIPLTLVAAQTDTSEREIRKHYAEKISHQSDEIMRRGLLTRPPTIRRVA